MDYDLFISYASPDLKFAEALQGRLTEARFSVWFDKARLNPGCDWHEEIEAGCEAARVILPILTPRWKQSEWTRYETYGHDRVIPLVFEGDFLVKDARGDIDERASVSTPPLRHLQNYAIDFQRMDHHEWPRLVAAIRSALGLPAPEPSQRLTSMRYGQTEYFVGREDKLNEIHEKLWTSPTATLTQGEVQIVTALGGVGKTTLARAYADRFWRLYPQAFWVDCPEGIKIEFASVFDLLFPKAANVGLDPNQKAKLAFNELNQPAARSMRLLVLDDALDEEAVQNWIPRTGRCHTIITSRFAGWSKPDEVCSVWELEPEPEDSSWRGLAEIGKHLTPTSVPLWINSPNCSAICRWRWSRQRPTSPPQAPVANIANTSAALKRLKSTFSPSSSRSAQLSIPSPFMQRGERPSTLCLSARGLFYAWRHSWHRLLSRRHCG